jgi:hypothetical protein
MHVSQLDRPIPAFQLVFANVATALADEGGKERKAQDAAEKAASKFATLSPPNTISRSP